jgi:hypothetical protein
MPFLMLLELAATTALPLTDLHIAAVPPLQIQWLGADSEALCMGGSKFGYYFRPAPSAIYWS